MYLWQMVGLVGYIVWTIFSAIGLSKARYNLCDIEVKIFIWLLIHGCILLGVILMILLELLLYIPWNLKLF